MPTDYDADVRPDRPLLSRDLLAHYRALSSQVLTVVDLETTGSVSGDHRVIEISVLQGSLSEGVIHQQTHLVNPGIPVPPKIAQFTGITTEMLVDAPSPETIWDEYWALLHEGAIAAHHLAFDYAFLQAEYVRLGKTFHRPATCQCCTVELSRLLLSHLPSRRLPALVRHFQFPVDTSHRAEADAVACWLLAERLLTQIRSESDDVLLDKFGSQHLSLSAAAAILGCSPQAATQKFEAANIAPLYVSRRGTPFYVRKYVEQVFWKHQDSGQLELPFLRS